MHRVVPAPTEETREADLANIGSHVAGTLEDSGPMTLLEERVRLLETALATSGGAAARGPFGRAIAVCSDFRNGVREGMRETVRLDVKGTTFRCSLLV